MANAVLSFLKGKDMGVSYGWERKFSDRLKKYQAKGECEYLDH